MAGVAKGIIDIQINTGSAAAELKNLQRQINAFNSVLSKANLGQGKIFSSYTKDLSKAINSSGVFTSEFVKLNSAASNLDNTLKRGRGTLGQFFSSAFNKNSAAFADTMSLAARRASTLQTQFINTGMSSKGMGEALAIRPLDAFSSKAAIAAERQALLNTMFRQGTTHMINFGKNVQWAGRQLMVGFTVPLTVLGTVAGKTFMDIEKQIVNLRKVYGDAFTTPEEVNQNIAQIRQLAEEYTKYGIAVKDTIGMAANAAASGARNSDLIDATRQATRLATLGQMEQQEALKTTIALQSAFRLSGEELADTINFLNMVENQTVVSLQDLSAAIPRVAPVIKGLGGDVRDMSVFLAAMQEGGVSAEQGANALKSGLASLINPTKAATETLGGFGINLDKIISANRGDLMGTVFAFGEALKGLDDFSKQQALEKVFGKYQYARLGALFENIVRDGSQASQVLQLMEYDVEALKATAEKELGAVENALGTQLIGAVERLKLSLEPIGKIFVEIAIPLVNFFTKIVEKFDGLTDGQKKFAAIAAVIVGVVVPAGTMFLGLLINLLGTLGKITHGFGIFGKALIKGGPVAAVKALTQSTKYLSIEELEAAGAAKQLASSTQIANDAMLKQATATGVAKKAVAGLVAEYLALISVQKRAAATMPGLGVAGAAGAAAAAGGGKGKTAPFTVRAVRRNKGGEIFMSGQTTVPGVGNTDTVPAMLTPGEFVVNKEATAQNYALLDAINSGNKFNNGGMIPGMQYFAGPRPNRVVRPRRPNVPFGQVEVNANAANARRRAALEDMAGAQVGRQERPAPPLAIPSTSAQKAHFVESRILTNVSEIDNILGTLGGERGRMARVLVENGIPVYAMSDDWVKISAAVNQTANTGARRATVAQTIENLNNNRSLVSFQDSSTGRFSAMHRLYPNESADSFTNNIIRELRDLDQNTLITDKILIDARNRAYPRMLTDGVSNGIDVGVRMPTKQNFADIINSERTFANRVSIGDADFMTVLDDYFISKNIPIKAIPPSHFQLKDSTSGSLVDGTKQKFAASTPYNKGGAVGGMQYFGARMPNRVVAKSQIKKFSGTKVADSTGHSSMFGKLAGVYDVNGRKMFVKPFATLEEAQAELIGNAARRRIAGTATPGSRIVRMDGPDGEIFATTAPMIPGMKAGKTLSTKELLKQIPASSMLGDLDATAGNILSTGGGRLATIDPGAAGVKFKRNEKGVFRRATGNEISFGSDATNTGAYTAKAITQLIEKTGASKDYVKMLGDSIAREGLTKTQFAKMYDDVVESAITRVPSFKLPSRLLDTSKLDEAAKSAGYKNADEAYSAIMLRDLTSIRGLGGDIYSSASRFQGMLKANSGTLVPGQGNTDTVPAMLTPGEFVINKEATGKNLPLLQAINNGETRRYGIGDYVNPLGSLTNAQRIKGIRPSASYQQSRSATGYNVFNGMGAAERVAPIQAALKTGPKYILDAYKDAGKQIGTGAKAISAPMISAGKTTAGFGKAMALSLTEHTKNRIKNIPGDIAYKRSQDKLYKNSPEGKQAQADRKAARAERMGKINNSMMMASMIPFMASSMVEDPKQQKGLMGLGAAMSIIPMLIQMGPVLGGVVAAAALLGGSFVALRKHLDSTAKSAAIFGSNLGGAANRMETISGATGYGFASTRSGTENFRFTQKQAENTSDIMPYFDTDEGKKLIEEMKKLSSEQRYEKVASMLTFAIADGLAPEKAEAFGSAIAFALDDALLKSKTVALIRSGSLQSGSKAMVSEISRRQRAADNQVQVPTVQRREELPGFSPFALFINAIDEYVYKQAEEVDLASQSFGSTIQTLKELNNAESLLNEERSKGIITNAEFTSSLKQINAMRDEEYKRVKETIDIGADTGAQQQAIKDQLVLSGFNADTAGAVANNTTTESIAKALGFDPGNLDKNQKEIVTGIIASTLDGITESNAATKIADIKDIYANMSEELLTAAADGITSAEMQDIITKSQIEKFVTSTFTDMPGMSEQQRTDKTNLMTGSINSALPEVNTLGVTTSSLVNGLSELSDPDMIKNITSSKENVIQFAKVLNALPEGWEISVGMEYFSGQNKESDPEAFFQTQKDVIDKIAKLLPDGADPMVIYNAFAGTGKDAVAELEAAQKEAQTLFDSIGKGETTVKKIAFESTGMDMTQKDIDAYNALGPGEQKTFLTSFIVAKAVLDVGEMPKAEDFKGAPGEAFRQAMIDYKKKVADATSLAKTLQGIGSNIQTPFNDPSDGPGGGGSGTSAKDKEADRLKKLNDLLRERFELQQMAIDKDTEVYNNSIDKLNRQIELEERQVKLRQRGLEELSKKEEAVNDAYNLRVEALDKVSESNSRIGEQERSRISLASALASGDIAAAANITSEMQQQSAQYQIEDARAALEKQRQVDLDALTVSINGKLMTRKGIEFEIEQIQDRIYNKGIEIQGLQDKLRILEDERLVIAKEREKVETRTFLMAQRQAILDLTGKNGKIPKENQQAYKDFVSSFNRIAEMYNQANPGAKVGRLNYGGSIAKMANGGITYKGSTEPPPPIMMNDGFTVPGKGMTDKVSALLTPGEFVVRKSVADKNRGFLQALNGQVFPGIGGKRGIPKNNFLEGIGSPRFSMPEAGASSIPVNNTNIVSTSSPMYNSTYNVNVNVAGTNASPDDIANVVMAKISNQNRGNLRSSRY